MTGSDAEPRRERVAGEDLFAAPALIAAGGSALGRPLLLLGTTTSTSDEAHRAAKQGAGHGTTWVAEEQTQGRGRRGRIWVSPPGEGLLFSVLLRLPCPPSRLPPLALLAGLAVREAVAIAAPSADVKIKWPNDIVVGGRKLAGVLVEAVTVGSRVEAVIVGIGINVHTRSFPADIGDRATSVALEATAGPPTRPALLANVLATMERELHEVVAHGLERVRSRIEAADALRGRHICNDAGDTGVADGIDDEGRLRVILDANVLARWSAGEVRIVRETPSRER